MDKETERDLLRAKAQEIARRVLRARTCAEVLGVRPGADAKAVAAAYRRLAMVLHPDRPTGDAEAFVRVNAAREALSRKLFLGGGSWCPGGVFARRAASAHCHRLDARGLVPDAFFSLLLGAGLPTGPGLRERPWATYGRAAAATPPPHAGSTRRRAAGDVWPRTRPLARWRLCKVHATTVPCRRCEEEDARSQSGTDGPPPAPSPFVL
jgi:hypothetical protein